MFFVNLVMLNGIVFDLLLIDNVLANCSTNKNVRAHVLITVDTETTWV